MRLLIVLLLAATTFAADDDFLRTCMTGMLLEPGTNQPYVCLGAGGSAHLKPGYSVDKAIGLMLAREDNAWKQLRNMSDLQERLGFSLLLAERGRAEYGKSPRIHDVTDVSISKTADKDSVFVIRLSTPDGRVASLWLDGGDYTKPLHVRSVSPY